MYAMVRRVRNDFVQVRLECDSFTIQVSGLLPLKISVHCRLSLLICLVAKAYIPRVYEEDALKCKSSVEQKMFP